MFTKKTVDKFLNLKNVGLIKNASGVGVSAENACKDTFKIYFEIENDLVVDAKFKAFGSPDFVAICDEITEFTKNKYIEDVLNISNEALKEIVDSYTNEKKFSVPFFKTAIDNAVKDYRKKQIKKSIQGENNN